MSSLGRALLRFIRGRTPRRPVAVARATVGVLALLAGIVTHHALGALFVPSVVRAHEFELIPDLRADYLMPLTALWSLAALGFALGLRTRLCGGLMVTMTAFLLATDQALYAGYLYVVGLLTLLLTLAGGGARTLPGRNPVAADPPAWPIVLGKLQVSLIYLFTATAKLNFHFLSGSILRRSLDVPFRSHWPPLSFQVMALLVILTEYFLGIGLWVRRLRPAVFLVAFLFHGSIVVLLAGEAIERLELFVFGAATLTSYLFFLEAGVASRTVMWNDHCGACRGWIRTVRRLDWLGIHNFRPASAPAPHREVGGGGAGHVAELEMIGPDGRRRGFDAVREILEVLPVSFLWAPAFRLRPFRAIAENACRAAWSRADGGYATIRP